MSNIIDVFQSQPSVGIRLPLFVSKVQAGFPSPADDYIDQKLDINKYLIDHPSATFFVIVDGDSMKNAGIRDNDVLIVDRSSNLGRCYSLMC